MLKQTINNHGYSICTLADITGLNYRTLYRRCDDEKSFRLSELQVIADALDMSLMDIVKETETPEGGKNK